MHPTWIRNTVLLSTINEPKLGALKMILSYLLTHCTQLRFQILLCTQLGFRNAPDLDSTDNVMDKSTGVIEDILIATY